ncbi:MAG TPA: FKBP-type peptidyl-prolyl cis-trans isomerase [Candidatus Bathyarchaeia archaeon]|nr:FKBP-type peptidyl-prolyl cis-trans isomerase [Candidatus Bathyarchaeia archaeon]
MVFQKGTLILVDYTAKVKDTNEVFETTQEADAKSNSIHDANVKYQPRLVSVGESWVLKGLDDALANANSGDKLSVEVPPEKGFGARDTSKVRMVPLRKLGDDAEKVSVGDTIELDDRTGIIRFIGSGRVQVDFNHRFAGRTILYDVNVIKSLDTDQDKIMGLLKRRFPLEESKLKFEIKGTELDIIIPEEAMMMEGLQVVKRAIANEILKFVTKLDKINFIEVYNRAKPQEKPVEQKAAEAKPAPPKAA